MNHSFLDLNEEMVQIVFHGRVTEKDPMMASTEEVPLHMHTLLLQKFLEPHLTVHQ